MRCKYRVAFSLKQLLLGIDCTIASEVASLSGEVTVIGKRVDTSKEELNRAVSSTRSVARKFVTGELSGVEGKTSFASVVSDLAGSGEGTAVVLGVVRNDEFLAGVFLKTSLSVPLNTLNGNQSTVGGEEHVEVTRTDDGVVGVLNNALESAIESRALAGVAERAVVGGSTEDVDVGALLPVGTNRCVDGLLNIGAVEVDDFSRGNVVAGVDTTKD